MILNFTGEEAERRYNQAQRDVLAGTAEQVKYRTFPADCLRAPTSKNADKL